MCRWLCLLLVICGAYVTADQPRYLYKVVSLEDWNTSQNSDLLRLSKPDVMLLKVDQLENTIIRDWNSASEVIIVEIDVDKLKEPVLAEKDKAGKPISYQYSATIPLSAISEPRIVRFH